MGHVPHMKSENVFAKSYARCTKTAIGDKLIKGFDVPPNKRYESMCHHLFNEKKNRRFCNL